MTNLQLEDLYFKAVDSGDKHSEEMALIEISFRKHTLEDSYWDYFNI